MELQQEVVDLQQTLAAAHAAGGPDSPPNSIRVPLSDGSRGGGRGDGSDASYLWLPGTKIIWREQNEQKIMWKYQKRICSVRPRPPSIIISRLSFIGPITSRGPPYCDCVFFFSLIFFFYFWFYFAPLKLFICWQIEAPYLTILFIYACRLGTAVTVNKNWKAARHFSLPFLPAFLLFSSLSLPLPPLPYPSPPPFFPLCAEWQPWI